MSNSAHARRPGQRRWRWRWWWGASLLVHTALVAGSYVVADAQETPGTLATIPTVEFEVPAPADLPGPPGARSPLAAASPNAQLAAAVVPPEPLGGTRSAQNLSSPERGERGDGRSLDTGRLMAVRAESVTFSTELMNSLRAAQEHRLRTARDRASPQDRRSTPNPGYDPWIALRDGVLLFRAPPAAAMPARGAAISAGPAVPTGAPPQPLPVGGEGRAPEPPPTPTGGQPRTAAGIAAATPGRATVAAGPSANGHASIDPGHASTTSDAAAVRPRDDADAEALATSLVRNALSTSVQAGPTRGEGRGGVGGGGAAGSGGGEGNGGRAHAFGEGGGWMSLSSPDSRYMRYFQEVRRRLDRAWANAFPRQEALQLRQGTVILRFVIASDGSVRGVAVQRHSGVDAFDRNVASAVAGVRLPPIPAQLGMSEIRVMHSFVYRNPIVR